MSNETRDIGFLYIYRILKLSSVVLNRLIAYIGHLLCLITKQHFYASKYLPK